MRKFLSCIILAFSTVLPLTFSGCGADGNRVVEETGEMTFDQLAAETAKETEAAEAAAKSAGK